MERPIRGNVFLKYMGLFFVITLVIYFPYISTHKSFIGAYDGLSQHYVALGNIKEFGMNILKGNSLELWDWSIGIGADKVQSYSYYGIGDIFSYIALFFNDMEVAFNVMMLSKVFFSGLGMLIFLKNKQRYSDIALLSGVLVYTFSGYVIHGSVTHPMFLTPMVILPYFLYSIDVYLSNKQPYLVSIVLCWALISNFYFAFFVILFGAIYFLLENYLSEGSIREKNLNFLKIIPYLVLGMGMSALFFAPAVYAFIHSTRADVPFANGIKYYPLDYYVNLFKAFIHPPKFREFDFHGGYAIVFVPAVFQSLYHFKQNIKVNIGLLIGLIGLLFPYISAVINGFSTPSLRWTFMFALLFAVTTANFVMSMSEKEKLTRVEFVFLVIFTSMFGIIAILGTELSFYKNIYDLMLVVVLFVIIFILYSVYHANLKASTASYMLFMLIIFNVTINGNYYHHPEGVGYVNAHITSGEASSLYKEYFTQRELELNIKTNDFQRISMTSDYGKGSQSIDRMNVGDFLDVNMLSSYYSLQNEHLGEFSSAMGNKQATLAEPLKQMDNRAILNNYLGVGYIFARKGISDNVPVLYQPYREKNRGNKEVSIYKTDTNFPLIYTMETQFKEQNDRNPLLEETKLTQGTIVPELLDKVKTGKVNQSSLMTIKNQKVRHTKTNHYQVDFNLKNNETGTQEVYMVLKGMKIKNQDFKHNSGLSSNLNQWQFKPIGTTINIRSADDDLADFYEYSPLNISSFNPHEDLLLRLNDEKIKEGNNMLDIFISGNREVSFEEIKIYKRSFYERLLNGMLDIQEKGIKDLQIMGDTITGKISTSSHSILTSSIPFTDGWRLKVDGVETPTMKVNYGFLGAEIESGEHEIELKYQSPWLMQSLLISIFSIIICIVLIIKTNFLTK
ncbi:hypothetical protein T233_01440 [Vagococcus lutrae LBD1]|uniref:YfhO family protein n=1 Tax=Vagococcus lutrae LBD1 TaxID=1408226 RepID=V6Q4V7_9ENTE|nr:YfhO family protein [Vagococcus lutrae]EST89685.1 hypothetical protein T233_01440 [Vagococcus lutrae LBD1]